MTAAARTQATEPPPDVLHTLECELIDARRVPGALRAIQTLIFPWRTADGIDIQNVAREDLGYLFEVMAMAAEYHLDNLDGITAQLTDQQRAANRAEKPGAA